LLLSIHECYDERLLYYLIDKRVKKNKRVEIYILLFFVMLKDKEEKERTKEWLEAVEN
jgi:hypothetical protein